jgi:hypothetical protein
VWSDMRKYIVNQSVHKWLCWQDRKSCMLKETVSL